MFKFDNNSEFIPFTKIKSIEININKNEVKIELTDDPGWKQGEKIIIGTTLINKKELEKLYSIIHSAKEQSSK